MDEETTMGRGNAEAGQRQSRMEPKTSLAAKFRSEGADGSAAGYKK
jgi:hypothetical protein